MPGAQNSDFLTSFVVVAGVCGAVGVCLIEQLAGLCWVPGPTAPAVPCSTLPFHSLPVLSHDHLTLAPDIQVLSDFIDPEGLCIGRGSDKPSKCARSQQKMILCPLTRPEAGSLFPHGCSQAPSKRRPLGEGPQD